MVYRQQKVQTMKRFKECQFCAEEIMAKAIKCKHCGSDVSSNIVNPQSVMASVPMKRKNSPNIAALLSFFFIGFGQFYNADIGKGFFMLVAAIVLVPLSYGILWIPIAIWSCLDAYHTASYNNVA